MLAKGETITKRVKKTNKTRVFNRIYVKKSGAVDPITRSFSPLPTGSLLLLTLIRNFRRVFFPSSSLHQTRRPHINSLLSAQTDLLDVLFAYRPRCINPGFIPSVFSFRAARVSRNECHEWKLMTSSPECIIINLNLIWEKNLAYCIEREIWSWRFFDTRLLFLFFP